MLSESAKLSSNYAAQIVDFMWVNDILLISLPFVAGLVLLRCFPQFFPQYSAKAQKPSGKLSEVVYQDAEAEPSMPCMKTGVSLEPLQSSQEWEASFREEILNELHEEAYVRSQKEEHVMEDKMAKLHASMMADLIAEEDDS